MSSTKMKKRLFVNCDGTGQAEYTATPRVVGGCETSPPVSNCARIGRATLLEDVENDFEQVVYYQTGVGADAEIGAGVLDVGQGAWGTGLTSNVRSAYGFICNNYDYGDEIYITGFSRGAFTARSVAGLIGRCGLLTKKGLNLFFEAVQYYRYFYDYDNEAQRPPCPVSEKAGTTRMKIPGTDNPITIKAVGVWDTVGALSSSLKYVKWRFHDVGLGAHVENAYHAMALNEHRLYFDVTLWESPKARQLKNFEQCWMVGDHSNIGGSWDDQQLADISLAWMMERFARLGVKFDRTYLYGEFLKFKNYMKNIAPNLPYDRWQNDPYPKDLMPRRWGEGRIHNLHYDTSAATRAATCGSFNSFDRTPGLYRSPTWTIGGSNDTVLFNGPLLQNTNETFHKAIRYRKFCKRNAKMGHNEFYKYNPSQLGTAWEWPRASDNGKIGQEPKTPQGTITYIFNRTVDNKPSEKVVYSESEMGPYEATYLGFYNQDPELQVPGEEKIWKQIFADNISQKWVDEVNSIISEYNKANPPETNNTPLVGPGIYYGVRPATADDAAKFSGWSGKDIKVGTWIGDALLYADSTTAGTYKAFTHLDDINYNKKLVKLEAGYSTAEDSIRSLNVTYLPKGSSAVSENLKGDPALQLAVPTTSLDLSNDKIVKVEIKARKIDSKKEQVRVCGLKVTTEKNTTWTVNTGFDAIPKSPDVQHVVAEPPISDWELKGFYGACYYNNLIRLGTIWGHLQPPK